MTDLFEKMNLGFKVGAKVIIDCFPTLTDPKYKKKPITWNEDTFYNRIGISDPKKMNDTEIKPEEELDFEDYEEDYEYDDSEYEE